MIQAIFTKVVWYAGTKYSPRTPFTIQESHKEAILKAGGQVIEDPPSLNPYKGFKSADLIAELEARQIDHSNLTNNAQRIDALLQDDSKEVENVT